MMELDAMLKQDISTPPTVAFSPAEIEYLASLLRRIEALERRVRELEQMHEPGK